MIIKLITSILINIQIDLTENSIEFICYTLNGESNLIKDLKKRNIELEIIIFNTAL